MCKMSLLILDKIMKKQKKYFKSPYVKGNEEYLHNEFSEKLPLDGLFEEDKQLSSTATSRRDFLKFLGGLQLSRYRNLKSGSRRLQDDQIILTLKLKSEDKKEELPLDFTFIKKDTAWKIDRITKVNS